MPVMRARLRLQYTPHTIALLAFLFFYLLLVIDVRHWSWRDPGSFFFDPEHAFDRVYSLEREEHAERYIQFSHDFGSIQKAGVNSSFCVGIPTIQRDGARYFRRALGSILDGLTKTERADIFVMPFIVNVDPKEHAAYNELWMERLADKVLTYADAEEGVVEKVKALINGGNLGKKALFDYVYMLRQCYETGREYILLVEDDTIAAEGWYKRTKEAMSMLEDRMQLDKMAYLRLFYNERLLGWNSEEWFTYLVRVLLVEIAVFGLLFMVALFRPVTRPALTPATVATITFILTPMLIAIYFLAGRLTVAGPSHGVNRMDSYGCCSQAFVFPRSQVPDLLAWYEKNANGYIDPVTHSDRTQVDSLTEIYAAQNGLARFALTPSVFQHVGGKSTKPTSVTRWGRSNTENIWNFGFEMLDSKKMQHEHVG